MNTEELYAYVRENFNYDNGRLIWNVERQGLKNKEIYTQLNKCGHLKCKIKGKKYFYHRLIFLYNKGYLPETIDHKNKVKLDNRITNLRHSSPALNTLNMSRLRPTDTNYIGVTYVPEKNKSNPFLARIKYQGRDIHLGYFSTLNAAKKVRKQAHRDILKEELELIKSQV